MIKKFNLKLIVFLVVCLYSTVLTAQINSTPAVVPFGANPNYGTNGIMPTNLPTGGAYGRSQDAADAYNEWKGAYVESCGSGMFRVKFDEPERTVSEGIGYGMQLAAYAADKTLFDGLYKYWKNFVTPATGGKTGKLMNWRIQGCGPSVSGTGSAADADVDAAWALLIAENQWPTSTSPYDYASEATNMLFSIRELEINSAGQLINGDGWGFGDNCRNPGYQSPAYYKFFATANPTYASAWNNAVSGGYTLINANADPTTGLISDWSNPSGQRNTCNPGGLGYAATDGYGYDACRNPWRMGQDVIWNNDAQAKAICAKIATYLSGRGAGNVGGPLYQNGNNYSGYSHNATFVATFATAVMGSTNQTLMNSMYTETKNTKDVIKNSTLSGYFGNTLRAVALFMMSGNYWKPGTTSIQDINVRQGTLNIPNAGLFDFQNQQNSVAGGTGKAITFTIENLGFTNLTLSGTPKVVVSGVDASSYTVTTQPALGTLPLAGTTTFVVTFNPSTNGTKVAALTIASNDPDEPSYVINLSGIGTSNATAPKMAVYDTLNVLTSGSAFPMGAFTAGSTGSKTIKITNTGDAPLNISAAVFSNVAFFLSSVIPSPVSPTPNLPFSIAAGKTGYLVIGYTAPAVATNSVSTITLTTTDPNAPTFVLNATANSAPCSANPTNKMMLDYDGSVNIRSAFAPKGAFSQIAVNPSKTGLNLSPTVASYVRPAGPITTPAWNGNYDIIRYYNCGTISGTTHANSTYVPFNVSVTNPAIQVLVYSPAVGIEIVLAPQKPDPGTTGDWLPLISNHSSNVSVTTTKANQWELITFDMSKIITAGVTADFKALDFQIDPLRVYAAAHPLEAERTFYIDEIKYGINPCINDLSGILQDFDAHNNTSLDYSVGFLTAPFPMPSSISGGLNTSANVGQYTKTITTPKYDDGFRYNGCSNKIDFTTKKYISMLVYSPVANLPIQISAKIPDGPDAGNTDPDDAAANTQNTVFANTWHRLYFDLSTISATDLPKVFGIDIFFDPNDVSGIVSGSKIYFDDIRLESALPCVTGIDATDILNDFENNRYLGIAFPGAAPVAPAVTYFNSIKANPSATGINTSAVVGEFLRGTATSGTSVRFTACQNKLDLAAGHNIIELKVLSPNPNVAVTLSLKSSLGTSLLDVTDTVKLANTWTNLRFDVTTLLNATNVTSIDVIVDANAVFSGSTSTAAARTYYFDDLKYAAASPEINVRALTVPTSRDIPNRGDQAFGTAVIGDSTDAINFSIQNNGLQTLTLTGTPILVKGGANPADFVVTTSPTFSSSIGAFGATGFTVLFKPQGTVAGPRSASITITSNDANEGTYIIYVKGTATAAKIEVLNGALTTSPVVANNNLTPINVGSAAAGTAAPAYTFSIKNTGTGPLSVTSVLGSAGFVATILPAASPIAAGAFSTFTVTGTPALPGVNTGTITIKTNDPATPTYVVNVTVTGAVPEITVQDKALVNVTNNNTTAISMGSGQVGVNVTPTYTFTITNSGTAPLTISGITSSNPVFSVPALPTPATAIAIGGTATFVVTSKPALAGLNTGIITIASNDPATPAFKVNVSVTGSSGIIVVKDKALVTVVNDNPAAISMGTSLINTAAEPVYTFTIANTGTGALTIASITSSSTVFVPSAITASPIAAGTSATFTVTAKPTLVGANDGILTITSNDGTTPAFKVNVTVTGTAPTLNVFDGTTKLTPATPAISLGTSTVGVAGTPYTTFNITNTGTGPLTLTSITGSTGFAVSAIIPTPLPASIPVGGTGTFTVTATPASEGANTGTITIVTTDPTTPSFVIKVSAAGTPTTPKLEVLDGTTLLTPATPAINIGTAAVGSLSTAYTSFSFKNTGTAPLTFTSITASANFNVTATPAAPTTIPAGGSVTLSVSGTPQVAGANAGTITIVTNDQTTASFVIKVVLTGTDVPTPAVKVTDNTTPIVSGVTVVDIGSAFVGSPATAYTTISVSNVGTGPLTLTSITGSPNFDVTAISPGASGTIAINGTVTFTVTGTPTAVGANAGTITITTNDPTTPIFVVKLNVTGKPLVPKLEVFNGTTALANPSATIDVGTAPLGLPATEFITFSIKNTGNGPLALTSILGSSGFVVSAVTPATPGSVPAGGSATFTVTATPTSIGTNTGTITIKTNDVANGTFVINVTSTGTAASPIVDVRDKANVAVANGNTPAVNLGSAAIGSPVAPYTFTINNTGNIALTGLAVATTSPGFNVGVPSATSIPVGGSATFTVTGTPSAPLTAGVITITSTNAATYVVNVSVSGTVTAPVVEVLDKNSGQVVNNNTPDIDLGTVVISGSTPVYTFTINNTGTAPLTNLNVATTSPGFTVSAPSATTIAVGGSATFTVTAALTTPTTIKGKINITSNAPAYVVNVAATGTSTPSGIVSIPGIVNGSTTPIDLGTVVENTPTAPKTITINNTGTLPLTITSISSDNAAFVIGGITLPVIIPAGGSTSFTIVGTPPSTSTVTGNIEIVSDDPNSPFKFPVKTTGKTAPTGGELQVIDNAPGDIVVVNNNDPILIGLNAAGIPVAPYKFTLKNTGIAPIKINNLSGTGGFTASPLTPAGTPVGTIGVGESASFTVTATPNTSGDKTGSIIIFSTGETFTLNLKVRVGTPTGVATSLSAGSIDVYPNPTLGSSYLEFNNNFDDVNVIVYSVDGNVVMTQKLASVGVAQTAKLDKIDELAAGIYLIEITTTQGKVVKRLIKQ